MRVVRSTAKLPVNNGIFIRDAALVGLSIALAPSFIVAEELRSGALRALNVGYEPEGADLYALTRHVRLAFGSRLIGDGPRTQTQACMRRLRPTTRTTPATSAF